MIIHDLEPSFSRHVLLTQESTAHLQLQLPSDEEAQAQLQVGATSWRLRGKGGNFVDPP